MKVLDGVVKNSRETETHSMLNAFLWIHSRAFWLMLIRIIMNWNSLNFMLSVVIRVTWDGNVKAFVEMRKSIRVIQDISTINVRNLNGTIIKKFIAKTDHLWNNCLVKRCRSVNRSWEGNLFSSFSAHE